ncbi:MAG: FAD-binding protein, partial [Nostoc sp. TH1S01]|nr:FAD-binding protein [Nostoc sp. TH1S01]
SVGDAATRELICGGFTGGGSHNAAWAISSGYWAGNSAAQYALNLGQQANQRRVRSVGEAALQPKAENASSPNINEFIQAVQAEVFPYNRNYFRTEKGLTESLTNLNSLWQIISDTHVEDSQLIRAREAAAMVATARWMYNSALERKETRGMHKHQDYPQQDANQQHYLISGGLDQVWVKTQPLTSADKSLSIAGVAA